VAPDDPGAELIDRGLAQTDQDIDP
jgi:hypothetical protein